MARAEGGESNKAIAGSLGISRSSVSTYLERARKKWTRRLDVGRRSNAQRTFLRLPPVARPRVSVARVLTKAERAVLDLALGGLSNAAIARERRASPRTVANQLSAVYRKLSIGSRRELRSKFCQPFQNNRPRSKVAM